MNAWLRQVNDGGGGGGKNVPLATPLNAPNARHFISKVTQKSVAKDINTVIESGVDVQADVIGINAGEAQRIGEHYLVNGRRYGVHNGTLYPVSGLGLRALSRMAYKALGVYNKFGDTPQAAQILDNMRVSAQDRDAARAAWQIG